jgi:hypothetical protein
MDLKAFLFLQSYLVEDNIKFLYYLPENMVMANSNRRLITQKEDILKALFGKTKIGVVAVVEVGCIPHGKPKQAMDNADYLRLILSTYCDLPHVEVYRGIAYWREPRDIDDLNGEMSEFGTDFAISHLRMPNRALTSLDKPKLEQLTTSARRLKVIERGQKLTEDMAYDLIVDEESRRNGDYSLLRGKIAQLVSRSVIERAFSGSREKDRIEGRVMECSTREKEINFDGEKMCLERNGQIDLVLTFPYAGALDALLRRMNGYRHVEVVRNSRLG